jgi:hypothetical protein
MKVQSSWVRVGLATFIWPLTQAIVLLSETGHFLRPYWWTYLLVPTAAIGISCLHYFVRVSIQNGLLIIAYPFRVRRTTCLFLTSEIQAVIIRQGFLNTLHVQLDEQHWVQLPCAALGMRNVELIKTCLSHVSTAGL